MSEEETKDLWIVSDPVDLEDVYFEKLDDALAFIKTQCDGGIESGDAFTLRLTALRKGS